MKIFVWEYIDKVSNNFHEDGGVVVFAETEKRARELANVGGCEIADSELPSDVRDVTGGDEKAYWFPNAGCC